MICIQCNRDIVLCSCPNADERLQTLLECPNIDHAWISSIIAERKALKGAGLGGAAPLSADGYKAAGLEIKRMLDAARDLLPERVTDKMRQSAGYRAGYHEGLLMAWCLQAYGEFPQSNVDAIKRALG